MRPPLAELRHQVGRQRALRLPRILVFVEALPAHSEGDLRRVAVGCALEEKRLDLELALLYILGRLVLRAVSSSPSGRRLERLVRRGASGRGAVVGGSMGRSARAGRARARVRRLACRGHLRRRLARQPRRLRLGLLCPTLELLLARGRPIGIVRVGLQQHP